MEDVEVDLVVLMNRHIPKPDHAAEGLGQVVADHAVALE
jgi:hypothetical protein